MLSIDVNKQAILRSTSKKFIKFIKFPNLGPITLANDPQTLNCNTTKHLIFLIRNMALNIAGTVADLRRTFNTGKTKDLAWRKQQLRQLIKLVTENEKEVNTILTPGTAKFSGTD